MVLQKLHPWVRQVLQSGGMIKQIPFMWSSLSCVMFLTCRRCRPLCVATRMLGRALPIEGMRSRVWEPQSTIAQYRADQLQWNANVEAQARRVTVKALRTKARDKSWRGAWSFHRFGTGLSPDT